MSFYGGQKPDADLLHNLDRSNTYTPTLTATTTNPDLGADGEEVGAWHRNGHWISGWMRFLFSGAGLDAGSGQYEYSLPFPVDSSIMQVGSLFGSAFGVGMAYLRDDSTSGNNRIAVAHIVDAGPPSVVRLMREGTAASVGAGSGFSDGGDRHTIFFGYLADPAGLP